MIAGRILTQSSQAPTRETLKRLQAVYSEHYQYNEDDAPVKIAVLDTGIDMDHPDFKQPRSKISARKLAARSRSRGEPNQEDRIKGRRNFCDDRIDESDVKDIDGHGTHVAGIILRLAPRAELYIARVCQGDAEDGMSAAGSSKDKPNKSHRAAGKSIRPDRVADVSVSTW